MFKVGLEIHFQLDTKEKLFCSCSTLMKEKQPIMIIERKLHPVESELGEKDLATQYEYLKDKKFFYEVYKNESCLVELDEEPPHEINKEALEIALKIALLFNCIVPDEIHVMRKIVIDGSNVSAFQRTAVVGLKGYFFYKNKKIKINQITLEEDAASIDKVEDNKIYYKLSRLGIPLIEISTDILEGFSSEEIEEIASYIGNICFSTGKVRNVLGSIRQDINISTEFGMRVEIKGVQELSLISKVIDIEIERQKKLHEILKDKNLVNEKVFDVTEFFRNSNNKIVRSIIENNGKIFAFKLPNFKGVLKEKITQNKTFGKELAEVVQNFGLKGIIHSDEDLKKYNLEKEFEEIKRFLNADENSAIIIIGEFSSNGKVSNFLIERINGMIKKESETRAALENGETKFLRPLPTAARMYPETDIPVIKIEKEYLESLKNILPETFDKKIEKFKNIGISEDLAKKIIFSNYLNLIEEFIDKYKNVKPSIIANFFVSLLKDLKRRENIEVKDEKIFRELFEKLNNNLIVKEALTEILKYCYSKNVNIDKAIEDLNLRRMSKEQVYNFVREFVEKNKNIPKEKILNILMSELRLKASFEDIKEAIEKL